MIPACFFLIFALIYYTKKFDSPIGSSNGWFSVLIHLVFEDCGKSCQGKFTIKENMP